MKLRLMLVFAAAAALSVGVASATAGGGNSGVSLCTHGGWQSVYTPTGGTFSSQLDCVTYAAHGGVVATGRLVWSSDAIVLCAGVLQCFGFLSGTGLKPNSPVTAYATFSGGVPASLNVGTADGNGNLATGPWFMCGNNATGIYATGTDSNGTPITSNTINTPCT